MRKYRVLLVVRHMVGGIRTFLRYVYKNIAYHKYEFTLISTEPTEIRMLLDDFNGLDLRFVSAGDYNVANKEFFKVVTKTIWNNKFDLIHSHGFTSGACSVLGSILTKVPHIITCHDVFTEKQFVGFTGLIKKIGTGLTLMMADSIHCVSNDAKNNLLSYLKVLKFCKNELAVIPNGIETERFINARKRDFRVELELSRDTFLIGFLGRFMSQKGFKYLIEAVEQIKEIKDLPKKPLILCFGEGGYIREDRDDIVSRGLAESVLFLPFISNVASTLKGLDVVVMPSLWEASGLLAMETMVVGVPLIGTNCIGLREVLKDTAATVIPARDSSALAQALIKEIKNPSAVKAGNFSTQAATRFNVKERAVEIEKLMLKYLDNDLPYIYSTSSNAEE